MAAINAKALKNALKMFFKENGRDPDLNEFKKLVTGQNESDKKKKDVESKETPQA